MPGPPLLFLSRLGSASVSRTGYFPALIDLMRTLGAMDPADWAEATLGLRSEEIAASSPVLYLTCCKVFNGIGQLTIKEEGAS